MKSSPLRIITIPVILVLGIASQVLYDPISSVKHSIEIADVRKQLAPAREKWEALNIENYTFEIQGSASFICEPSATILIKNGVVEQVESTERSILFYEWADPDWGDEVFLCNYNNFTVEKIFDLLNETLQYHPSTIIDANFDPQYGFVTYFKYGLFMPNGLLNPHITNCCSEFQIKNFQSLK